ncbi:MAG: argininosuccinate lyase [SAR202 cluster bacterium]|nr:argininosuccinate lyase [SAR202 cluster bacterium]|tara:strand:+ start:805 stop:2193 length:1389 start_codon:yes stop_codon:yes gene_type:complete
MYHTNINNSDNEIFQKFTESISYDRNLFKQDIKGSIAHAKMLAKQNIISPSDADKIASGLTQIQEEILNDKFVWKYELEDIHMNIESRLKELIGDIAGKLHTARSRNDQIALDMRLFLKETIVSTIKLLLELQSAILTRAEENIDVIVPGYTHMQRAQPLLLSHHLMAYFNMFARDINRFENNYIEADVMPLGSGALAGVPYSIDREFIANELSFSKISTNSMDSISDRDYILEFLFNSATTMSHISRICEEIILWSTQEFNFISLDKRFTTGSSMMPQKRNPDFAEISRGKIGRVYGNLIGLLTVIKGLPLTYNRDLQEDKEGLFDSIETLQSTLKVLKGMIETSTYNKDVMLKAAEDNSMLATDMADYLVGKGVPFRKAHEVMYMLVDYANNSNKTLKELSLSEYKNFLPEFEKDIFEIDINHSINQRNIIGGTSLKQVKNAIKNAKNITENKINEYKKY